MVIAGKVALPQRVVQDKNDAGKCSTKKDWLLLVFDFKILFPTMTLINRCDAHQHREWSSKNIEGKVTTSAAPTAVRKMLDPLNSGRIRLFLYLKFCNMK
jgi:hypothetical protein